MAEHAETNNPSTEDRTNPVPAGGDHDRVQMLSLRPDGTHDQLNPELIGDKDVALAAAKRQFAEQAVSAVDAAERGAIAGPVTLIGQKDGGVKEIPATRDASKAGNELKAKHDEAAAAAEKAAEAVVDELHQG